VRQVRLGARHLVRVQQLRVPAYPVSNATVSLIPNSSAFAKQIERCSDGVEDPGAEEASRGQERIVTSVLETDLSCERLSFQRTIQGRSRTHP
jgi:hypothetical protein